MEKKVEISILCQLYGKLLTTKQLECMDDYYNNDLSLSEIAQNNGTTRQAVKDIITKSEKKLFEYEKNLEFKKKTLEQEDKIKEILENLEKINQKNSNEEIEKLLKKAKKEIKYLALN